MIYIYMNEYTVTTALLQSFVTLLTVSHSYLVDWISKGSILGPQAHLDLRPIKKRKIHFMKFVAIILYSNNYTKIFPA